MTSRKGESSPDFTYPRILGIECVGLVDAVTEDSTLKVGQQVATMMGGMGRGIDGSYAEYTLVREEHVIPFSSDLPWGVLGALPEMFQTAYGSLHTGLGLELGQSILIRGGTSTVGLSAITLAHELGAHVIATTRTRAAPTSSAGTEPTKSWLTMAPWPTKYERPTRLAWTQPSSSSASTLCPPRSAPSALEGPAASPARSRERGPWKNSPFRRHPERGAPHSLRRASIRPSGRRLRRPVGRHRRRPYHPRHRRHLPRARRCRRSSAGA